MSSLCVYAEKEKSCVNSVQGYLDAAKAFEEESGTSMEGLDCSEERMHIRNALEKGQMDEAISRVNDLSPEVAFFALLKGPLHLGLHNTVGPAPYLACMKIHSKTSGSLLNTKQNPDGVACGVMQILESDAELFFHLQQQQMIELIREGKIVDALLFAQEYLAYKGEENPGILDELGAYMAKPAFKFGKSTIGADTHVTHAENTIALIAFEDPTKCPVKHLMESKQRQGIASEMNRAILRNLNHNTEPKLAQLVKMLSWCQDKLEARAEFPRLQDLQLSTK
jgi:hypothetical protein